MRETYTVSLTATDAAGSNTKTVDYITVTGGGGATRYSIRLPQPTSPTSVTSRTVAREPAGGGRRVYGGVLRERVREGNVQLHHRVHAQPSDQPDLRCHPQGQARNSPRSYRPSGRRSDHRHDAASRSDRGTNPFTLHWTTTNVALLPLQRKCSDFVVLLCERRGRLLDIGGLRETDLQVPGRSAPVANFSGTPNSGAVRLR